MKFFLIFLLGLGFLIGVEVARVYYIMPFPGSQVDEAVELAYFIQSYIWWFRLLGILVIAYPSFLFLVSPNAYYKWTTAALLAFWLVVCYAFNFQFQADKMFLPLDSIVLLPAKENKVDERQLVVGINSNGESKAYPIEVIGYHHQLLDTIGGQPVMITYCTVCRTGRVYSPIVNGKHETFRLVGMDHFNAMFEDASTKSWWRQVDGTAIVGPLKGSQLKEVSSEQMSLSAWLERNPQSLILQPDPSFKDQYETLAKYDEGKMEGKLEGRDSLSWKDKSWVVGVSVGLFAKAYDWNELVQRRAINDHVAMKPLVVALQNDSTSFHVWSSVVADDTLLFSYSDSLKRLIDQNTKSVWNWSGQCTEGKLVGASLERIQSYQEFWHSWKQFHPQTEKFVRQKE